MRSGRRSRGPIVASLALAASLLLAGAALRRAVEVTLPAAVESSGGAAPIESSRPRTAAPLDSVLAAVDVDPFNPERTRPPVRFRLPGERVERVARPVPRPSVPSSLVLTGTVIYPGGGGLAVLSQDRGATMTLRVGESLGELKLEKVERERAIFSGPGGRQVVIPVRRSGP